jgi:CheY-like chemotaxis protein
VISDIAMPHTSGYELASQLRQEPELDNIVLVALTGYGRDTDKQRAIDAGFDYHLVKPVSVAMLRDIFDSLPEPEAKKSRRPKRTPR